MKLVPRFLTFLEQVRAASRTADLGQTFQSLAEDFGYAVVSMVDVTKLSSSLNAAIVFHTMPKAQIVSRKLTLVGHPLLSRAEVCDSPFLFEDVRKSIGADETRWNELLPPHLRGMPAVVLPVHREGRLAWYVSSAGARADASQLTLSVLHTAAHVAYDRQQALSSEGVVPGGLSRREGACIRWIAAGKTDEEISAILRIAPRTVRFHVANAKKKLGVSTRIQAVAARLQRGGLGA
jgi:DNA-binding CsgD family transcriptional regulator